MIVKKLQRKIRCKWWDNKRKTFERTTIKEYMGWFLFGFIPIYLIELDRYEDFDFESGKGTERWGIHKSYGKLLIDRSFGIQRKESKE